MTNKSLAGAIKQDGVAVKSQTPKHTSKPDPAQDQESKSIYLKVTPRAKREIKQFAADHDLKIKDVMMLGFEKLRKSYSGHNTK